MMTKEEVKEYAKLLKELGNICEGKQFGITMMAFQTIMFTMIESVHLDRNEDVEVSRQDIREIYLKLSKTYLEKSREYKN